MTPQRTCIGCGARGAKWGMHRLVREASTLVVDGRHAATGRGAYVHPKRECVAGFASRRGAIRSLRWTPPSGERDRIAEALQRLVVRDVR